MKMLKNTKRELKDDLNVKALSLVIDRQKCMAIRLNFPYHTRCVCTSLKEDEAQVSSGMRCSALTDTAPPRTWRSLGLRGNMMKRPLSESKRREEIEDPE